MTEQGDFPTARPLVGKLFPMRGFAWEEGLRDQVVSALGDQSAFGFAMGEALFRHSCGVWGSASCEDRALNAHVLDAWREGRSCGGWVTSHQRVAGLDLEIATDLQTGETLIRRPTRVGTRPSSGRGE